LRNPGKGKPFDMRAYTGILKEQRDETAAMNRCLRAMRFSRRIIQLAE
jgi:hypothetical protein